MSKVNGDEIQVHHGDKVITLDEQLAGMSKAIRRLEVGVLVIIVTTILSALLTDEQRALLVNGLLDLVGG